MIALARSEEKLRKLHKIAKKLNPECTLHPKAFDIIHDDYDIKLIPFLKPVWYCGTYTIMAPHLKRIFRWLDSVQAVPLPNTPSTSWHAITNPKHFARNATNRQAGCVFNVFMKVIGPAICVTGMSRITRMKNMGNPCLWSTHLALECAGMKGQQYHRIKYI